MLFRSPPDCVASSGPPLTLATLNAKDFQGISGLWLKAGLVGQTACKVKFEPDGAVELVVDRL